MRSPLLSRTTLHEAGVLPQRSNLNDSRVTLTEPATLVMNDFAREFPVTVDEDQQIDAALNDMIRLGVRALVVMRERQVVGLITSYDIKGERPSQSMQRLGYSRHDDILVRHVMTPWAELQTLNWRAVNDASVGDVLESFHQTGVMHLLVVDTSAGKGSYVKGLFSRSRLARQLGQQPAVPA